MSDGSFPQDVEVVSPPVVTGVRTLSFKVQPDGVPWLDQAAREVNQVWNWASATSRKAVRSFSGPARWLSAYDLNGLCAGVGECFERIGIDVAQCVNQEFVTRRQQFRKTHLRFRHSGGSKRALGWIPFKAPNLRLKDQLRQPLPKLSPRRKTESDTAWSARQEKHQVEVARIEGLPHKRSVQFMGKTIRLFQVERLFEIRAAGGRLRGGNFSQNALGEWFLNVAVEEPLVHQEALHGPLSSEGFDPGQKHATMTSSTGQTWDLGHSYRTQEARIAQAQRRGHKGQAKHYHQKAKNVRQDMQNKMVREVVDRSQHLFIGNAPCALITRGTAAKSGYDHAWGMLRTRLINQGHRAGRTVELVHEAYTTSTCSSCGSREGPTGLDKLTVRQWTCSCGVPHDRDVNAARNIEQLGWLALTVPPRRGRPLAGTRDVS